MKLRQILVTLVLSLLVSQAFAELPSPARFNVTELEVSELNLAREIVMTDRLELNIIAESEQSAFLQVMTQRLNELGWELTWSGLKGQQMNNMISDFYRLGGQHLRLEIAETSPNNYRMLIYRF